MDLHKRKQTLKVIELVQKTQNTVLLGYKNEKNIRNVFYDFQIEEWKATNQENSTSNPETKLQLCEPRPYGKWYDLNFNPVLDVHIVCYFGIFAVAREHIIQHPKSYYEKLIKYVETHSNPEAGHYMERSWGVIFYPYPESCVYTI